MLTEITRENLSVFPMEPVLKDESGCYPFPRRRFGILSCFVEDGRIIWGCVESDRVGPATIVPPAGVQDVVFQKGAVRFSFEAAKPIPPQNLAFLEAYHGQLFRDAVYQKVLTLFEENGFDIYFENSLLTALHESEEEHGVNILGTHASLLEKLYSLPVKKTSGVQDSTTQQFWLALLKSNHGVVLKHTEKTDQKIRRNMNRPFYEKGCWGTLNEFEETFGRAFLQGCETFQTFPLKLDLIVLFLETFKQTLKFLRKLEQYLCHEQGLKPGGDHSKTCVSFEKIGFFASNLKESIQNFEHKPCL